MARRSTLYRLYRTKFTLLATISFFAGVMLLFLSRWTTTRPAWTWTANLPLNEIGSGLLFSGLFGVAFQFVGQADADALASERFRQVITEEAPAIQKAVVDAFALEPEKLSKVAAPATLDKLAENSLALRLGDKDFAAAIYNDLRAQTLRTAERHFDKNVTVSLAPWEGDAKRPLFVATVRFEYRATNLPLVERFACTSDTADYRELAADPSVHALYFEALGTLNGASAEVFQLEEFKVNGRQLPARRVQRAGSQILAVNVSDVARSEPVTISYTYRQLIQQHGHLFHVDVTRPTRGLHVSLHYGNCGIRFVNVLDYIASAKRSNHSQLPASGPTPSAEVAFDGWALPKAGVAFVWVLDEEIRSRARN